MEGTPAPDALERLQAEGIGERRGEGYGELVLNPPLLEELEVPRAALHPDRPEPGPAGDLQPTPFTRALQQRAARLAIRRKALEGDSKFRDRIDWQGGASPIPPNTQLGALRALLESLHDAAGLERIGAWLTAVDRTEKRSGKWPDATKRCLARHLDNDTPASVWESLDMAAGPATLPGHDRGELMEQMRIEAIRTIWLTAISRQLNENNRSHVGRRAAKEAEHGA